MPVTFKTFVQKYDVAPSLSGLQNVIVRVHWRRTATDGTFSVEEYGTLPLPPPNPQTFIPIASVSKEQMATWYSALTPADLIATANARMSAKIADLASPAIVPARPSWNPNEEVISS